MSAPDPSRILVTSDDPRLSDARPPSAHTHPVSDVGGLQAALDGKAATGHTHTKAQVGLGNVDNTSDASKPVSTATQSALNGKADTGHTHTWSQISNAPSYSKDATGDNLVQRAANGHINVPAGAGAQNAPRRSEVDAAINAKIQLVTDFPTSPVAGVLYLKAE